MKQYGNITGSITMTLDDWLAAWDALRIEADARLAEARAEWRKPDSDEKAAAPTVLDAPYARFEAISKLAWAEYLLSDKLDGLAWARFTLTHNRAWDEYMASADEKAASDTAPDNDNRQQPDGTQTRLGMAVFIGDTFTGELKAAGMRKVVTADGQDIYI